MSDSLVRVSRRVGPLRQTARSWDCNLRRGRAVRESSTQGPLGDCRGRGRWRACWRGPRRSCPPCWTSPARRRQRAALASNDFTYYFTFFSKFFSSFPHGTCTLSISGTYLALGESYHLLYVPLPKNVTLCEPAEWPAVEARRAFHPLLRFLPKRIL